jgi:hypothetical protein
VWLWPLALDQSERKAGTALLWQRLPAKDPAKGYGAVAVGKQWGWYETWLNRVREVTATSRPLPRESNKG